MLVASACGRVGFDHGAPADGASGDAVDTRSRCPAAPRPDVSAPDLVVGDGTPSSCDEAALQAALDTGGTIALRCGPARSTIVLTKELAITGATVLDGGGLVTLDASGASGIRHAKVIAPGAKIVLLGLRFETGTVSADGGAVYVQSGDLVVIDSAFDSSTAVNGGAIAMLPTAGSLAIYDSVFDSNTAKTGGAIYAFDDLTLVETAIRSNRALGPADGSDGGLGGGIVHAGPGALAMCGVTLADNTAGYLGGGLHRVCTTSACADTIERSSVVNNSSANGGGLYIQNTSTAVRQSTIANNLTASGVGGLWYIGSAGLTIEQSTIVDNAAMSGLGAGLRIAGPGTIAFSTIASNACSSAGCDSSGIEATSDVTLRATVIADNTASGSVGTTCRSAMTSGTGSFQWPTEPPCAPSVQFVDPLLGDASERSGPGGTFIVSTPDPGSPVRSAIGSGCPAEDQLGRPRPTPCSAGAIELEP